MISPQQTVLYAIIFFLAGIILGNFFISPIFLLFCLSLIFLFLSLVSRDNLRILFIFSAFLVLGIFRYQIVLPNYNDTDKIHGFTGQQEFIGVITESKSDYGWQSLVVDTQSLISQDHTAGPISGRVALTATAFPKYQPGDRIRVECVLKNYDWPPVGFDRYLFKENIFSRCQFATINKIGQQFLIRRYLFLIGNYFEKIITTSTAEPAAAILSGILLNSTQGIPKEISDNLAALGLTHIIAISGSHLVIVMVILTEIFILLGLSRLKAFWPIILIIIFYVCLVGAPASAVRSAIMASLLMFAQRFGRWSTIGSLLIFSAALMALFNPRIIIYDLGFQLSFLAIIGLAYLSPLIKISQKSWPISSSFKEMIAATLSAQIATYPLIIYYFGNFSLWSLLANLLILPTVPALMSLGLSQLFLGIFIKPLAVLIGLGSWLIIKYWLLAVEFLMVLPAAQLMINNFSLIFLLVIYLIIFIIGRIYLKLNRNVI